MSAFSTMTRDELATMREDAARLLRAVREGGPLDAAETARAERLLAELLPRAAAEVEALRLALGFYADMNLWQRAWLGGGFTDSPAHEDGGEIARRALRGLGGRLADAEPAEPA